MKKNENVVFLLLYNNNNFCIYLIYELQLITIYLH